jgi:hypothetical protein
MNTKLVAYDVLYLVLNAGTWICLFLLFIKGMWLLEDWSNLYAGLIMIFPFWGLFLKQVIYSCIEDERNQLNTNRDD